MSAENQPEKKPDFDDHKINGFSGSSIEKCCKVTVSAWCNLYLKRLICSSFDQLISDFRIFVQWQLVKMRVALGVLLIVCASVNADVSQKPPPKRSDDETAKFDALYEDLFTVFKKGLSKKCPNFFQTKMRKTLQSVSVTQTWEHLERLPTWISTLIAERIRRCLTNWGKNCQLVSWSMEFWASNYSIQLNLALSGPSVSSQNHAPPQAGWFHIKWLKVCSSFSKHLWPIVERLWKAFFTTA